MAMKHIIIISFVMAFTTMHASAELLFDANFEPPTYTNGQFLSSGFQPYQPTYASHAGEVFISNSIPGFTSQAVIVGTDYGSMNFLPSQGPYTSGVHLIGWDMGAPNPAGTSGQATLGGTHFWLYVRGWSDAPPEIVYPGIGASYPGAIYTIESGRSYSIGFLVDLDSGYLNFYIDDVLVETNYPLDPNTELNEIYFSQNSGTGPQMAIDNFKWLVTPRPNLIPSADRDISWLSETGMTYRVQSTTNLLVGTWSNITAAINATSEVTTIFCPTSGTPFEALRTILEYE